MSNKANDDAAFIAAHENPDIDSPADDDNADVNAELAEMSKIDKLKIDWNKEDPIDTELFGQLISGAKLDDDDESEDVDDDDD